MKKFAGAVSVCAVVFGMVVSNANAGDTRTGRVPAPRPEEPTPRCVMIGSDIWECTDCIESEADNMSICTTYITKNEVPKEP